MSGVSEESLLDYFYSTGGISGRVKNADILKTFKPFIGHSDVQLRAKYREEFKLIIDRIAAVKSENGEKYLVLKKKYRQMLQDRDARLHGTDGDAQRGSSPARAPAAAQWDASDASTSSHQQKEPQDEPMLRQEQPPCSTLFCNFLLSKSRNPPTRTMSWTKIRSESEQDEESTGSMGSAAVATALHWAAKHGNQDMAALVANAGADVNTKSGYTPLHIAALHGHRHILDLLIVTYGAKENLRDYSGHLAGHYLNIKEPEGPEEENRKLASLFHSKKRWGSAEELAPIEEERTASHQLILPAFRPRKFSR
ncbi:hypothetical protein F7725_001166 [Dissostichus mawsoni]|uniref:SOWAHA-C winged helix-turn-helix domain-containing protein n=1 Tax=Dissostichus mawsoni TaxID=36200 RepID=A0A7J5ZIC6_DISMA|nr:hypothetical protein F7725_001166 [Dissostichus mawsoni]